MRTRQRMKGIQKWIEKNLCEGRELKAPAKNFNIKEINRQTPKCYLAWMPYRVDEAGIIHLDEQVNVAPGIVVMPNPSVTKFMEEQRFDRYNNIHRHPDMGGHFKVSILFCVYEPGIRLPGFADSADANGHGIDLTLMRDGTEEGLFTLTDWMDDCTEALLRDGMIDGTDLYVEENTITYSLYTDQEYVVDRRPMFYGFVNVSFGCHADDGNNPVTNQYLL